MTKHPQAKNARRLQRMIWIGTLTAGTCFATTCDTRVRDSLVFGTRNFILQTLLNPANFIVTADDAANTGN